jgi:flagellin
VPFTINTNIASLQAQNYLRVTNDFQSKTINRVTSGLRIVTSGDDAAGLAIANSYRSDEAVLAQGVRNGNDGLSQLQTADGGINNISQLLDRARTLATQSASGAFTGDRSVLNSEFQTVIGEIDRQAQAIGLNQGGQFAKALSVFIGGGQASNGISATVNGSVSVDLSHSTVDSASLGLKGVQAIGVSGTDIGSGSASTSLSQILANSTNSNSVATPGFTTFVIKGPGFDGNGVRLTVNTANLGGTSDLVNAVNAAISAAGNGGTQQATAFKNANVTAAINTDANGKQQLVFKSSTTAFQVEAGDRLANALLGNFEQNAVSTGTDTSAYVDTSGANDVLTFSIDGGSTFNVTVTQAAGTSKGQIVKDLNANATFSASAIAYLDGNQIAIKSKTNSSSSSVAVTSGSGSLATTLGFSGTASAAAASTGADLNVRVQGSGVVAAAANVIGTDTGATATIASGSTDTLILTVGATGPTTLTLTGGTGLTKAQIAADINTQIGSSALANKVSAKVVNNQIVLTAATPGQNITVGNGTANAALGFTNGTVATAPTVATSDTITLRFQGSGLTSPVDITLNATTGGTTTVAQVLADLQTKIAASSALTAAGISLTTSAAGNNLVFTSNKGERFQVSATGDSTNILGLGTFLSGSGGAVDYTSITAGSNYSTSGASGTATFEVSLNGNASSSNTFTANLAGGDATAGSRTGTVVYAAGVIDFSGNAGNQKLAFRIDGGAVVQTAALGTNATTTIASVLSAINTALGASGTATLDGSGNIVITSASKGANSSVEIVAAGAAGSDANVLTQLGFATGATHGSNASEANVIQQLNNSIASNSALVAAGLQARDNGSGKIEIVSNNGTYFRLNARNAASGYTGDAGFGYTGSGFSGQVQGAAPATSPYFDAQGADASATLAYTDTLYGSDDQTVSIGATDANGVKHSLSVTLRNDGTARYRTIDEALNAINSALQQSNDTTLNRIVAVKEESSGTQSIRFLSTVRGFQVTVSSDPNATGITPPSGNQTTATTQGTGANADITDQASAQAAVAAIADAVSLLGKAQAVVGRGQNQFTFAINLAQSQLTNLAAAESRIRDADLAAESANLTKSQILLQAGIAALAQANSAPQQVLTLLRG